MRRMLGCWLLLFAAQASAGPLERGAGYHIELPPGWEAHRNIAEAPLLARPPPEAKGWGNALLLVDSRALSDQASCLDGQFQRRLRQLAARASKFADDEEQRLTLHGQPAFETVLRYSLGNREFSAYLLMVQAHGRIASALVTAEPAAFELHRVELRKLVESLRAEAYKGPDYVPPKKS